MNGRDFSQILLNNKDQQAPIVSCARGRYLLSTITLFWVTGLCG